MNFSNFIKVVGLKFRDAGRIYYYDSGDHDLKLGTAVVANTPRGEAMGKVVIEPTYVLKEKAHLINLLDMSLDKNYILANLSPATLDGSIDSEPKIPDELSKIIRPATDKDIEQDKKNKELSIKAKKVCTKLIQKNELNMKLVSVEYSHNGKKAVLYFTAKGRIDFRTLVKDLLNELKVRIELRQIDVRDETKLCGGIGPCGRELCCKSFLRSFKPVTIKTAKEQNLALNPSKISGLCARLMCCLTYEVDTYSELKENFIKIGTLVKTPNGEGKVYKVNVFSGIIEVLFEDGQIVHFSSKDVKKLKDSDIEGEHLKETQVASEEELKSLEDPDEVIDIKDTFLKPAPREGNNKKPRQKNYNKDNRNQSNRKNFNNNRNKNNYKDNNNKNTQNNKRTDNRNQNSRESYNRDKNNRNK